jgi:hypothetical protein
LRIDTSHCTPEEAAEMVIARLTELGVLPEA